MIMLVRRISQGWHYFSSDDYCLRNLISHPIYIPSISNHWSMVATIHQSPLGILLTWKHMLPIHQVATVDGETIQHLTAVT